MLHSGAVYWNLLLGFNISAIPALLAGCSLGTNTFTRVPCLPNHSSLQAIQESMSCGRAPQGDGPREPLFPCFPQLGLCTPLPVAPAFAHPGAGQGMQPSVGVGLELARGMVLIKSHHHHITPPAKCHLSGSNTHNLKWETCTLNSLYQVAEDLNIALPLLI